MKDRLDSHSVRFATTNWALIGAAADAAHPARQKALNELTGKYWRPVYGFLRARRIGPQEAEDLTQEFLFRLCDRNWISRADANRGRFRTFVLTLLVRFVADQSDQRTPRQRQFDRSAVPFSQSFSQADVSFEPVDSRTPEAVFMEQWTAALLQRVQHAVQAECQLEEGLSSYEIFAACSLVPEEQQLSQRDAAARFGISRDRVRTAIDSVRTRLKRQLAEELRLDGCPEDRFAEEFQQLICLLQLPS